MKARKGDRLVLAANRTEGPVRDGEILEVRGPDGAPPYLVRWSDGHTALVFPGPDAIVHGPDEDLHHRAVGGTLEPRAPLKQWQVQISVYEKGDDTEATAVLLAGPAEHLAASGHSHRSSEDEPATAIGDEVAVARALRHLADTLLATAESEIESATGKDAFVRPL